MSRRTARELLNQQRARLDSQAAADQAQAERDAHVARLVERSDDHRRQRRVDENRENFTLATSIFRKFRDWAERTGYPPQRICRKTYGWKIINITGETPLTDYPETVRFDRGKRYPRGLYLATDGRVLIEFLVGRHMFTERHAVQYLDEATWHTIGRYGKPELIARHVAGIMHGQ